MKTIIISLFLIAGTIFANPALNIADSLLKAKDYKKAEKKYSAIILDDATNKDALYGKAFSLMKMKEYLKSSEVFNVLITIDSNFNDSVYRLAFVNRKLKKYAIAVKLYKQYVTLNPTSETLPDAYYGLAQTYKYMKDKVNSAYFYNKYTITEKRSSEQKWVKKAKKTVEKLIAEFNADEKKRYDSLIQKENQVSKTEEKKENIIVKKESNVKKENSVNVVVKKENNIVKKEIKSENSANVVIVKKKEIPIVTKKETKKSNNVVKKESDLIIPKKIENESAANKNLNYMFKKDVDGDKLYLEGKYKEAIQAYRGYLSISSKRREGLFKTAVSYALLKKYKDSVDMFSQIIIEEQDDKKVKKLLTLLLSNQIVIEHLLEKDTKIKNGIAIKAVQSLVMKGDYNQALGMLDILIEKVKQNSKAVLYKLDLLRIVGRNDDISKTILYYLTRYPNDSLVNERYGDILKADGKKDKAERYYQKAFANAKNKAVSKRLEQKMAN